MTTQTKPTTEKGSEKTPSIPRWLEIQMEVDYRYFLLHQMLEHTKKRSGMDVMIDQATGFEQSQIAEATQLHTEIKELIKEYNSL